MTNIDISQHFLGDNFLASQQLDFNIIENSLTYNEFFEKYLLANKSCIIKNVSDNWAATKYWVKFGSPNFEYLESKYGRETVTIYDCDKKYYNSQETSASTFSNYMNYWKNVRNGGDNKVLYLKDWHLKKNFPDDHFYKVPVFFASDWLNEYCTDNSLDDYQFVYMGPKGTWTPFHADVFTSYSWSVNICGQKRWLLLPPGEENQVKDNYGNLPHDLTRLTAERTYQYFEVIQNSGEALFVPSGWYHQVFNVTDSISINHNWINACNVLNVWKALRDNLLAIKREISDCEDMDNYDEHCQVMLKASFGLNLCDFYKFMKHIAVKRISFLEKKCEARLFKTYSLGKCHALYDLKCLIKVLELFLKMDDVSHLQDINIANDELLDNIKICMDNNNLLE